MRLTTIWRIRSQPMPRRRVNLPTIAGISAITTTIAVNIINPLTPRLVAIRACNSVIAVTATDSELTAEDGIASITVRASLLLIVLITAIERLNNSTATTCQYQDNRISNSYVYLDDYKLTMAPDLAIISRMPLQLPQNLAFTLHCNL